jgi:glutamate-1-semialdehyde 2,1-aminomutase
MSFKQRADLAIAQGALTNSKRPSTYIEGVYPTHAARGRESTIYANGQAYVDYVGGLGTNLLGYGNPFIADAVYHRFLNGATLSLSSEIEVELAEKLKMLSPWTDLWKFTKSGTEACNAALRIARTFTGRDLVLSDGYHGWSDDFVSMSPPALGIPRRDWMQRLDFQLIPQAAAVIIEPVITDWSNDRKVYLQTLAAECKKHGTVLIFDEIITGFRFPGFSVTKYFGLEPDMILLGKALGGGMPLSAIGGRKDLMNCGEYFVSGTFFGETVSMAAAITLIDLLKKDGTRYPMADLWSAGARFLELFNAISPKLKIDGYPTRGAFVGDDETKALFWQEACKAGIIFGPSWFFNFPLMSLTDTVIPVCRDILGRIKVGSVRLEGNMPKKPFAQTVRGASEPRKDV